MRASAVHRGVALLVGAYFLCAAAAQAAAPSAPTITEPATDGQQAHPGDVHMEAGGFADPDGDEHECTDWEIVGGPGLVWEAPCAGGLEKGHIHLGDGDFVNAYAGRTSLEFDAGYTLRARFRDDAEEASTWAERPFGTYPASAPGGDVPWTAVQPGYVVEEVAGDFRLPVNIAFVPNPGTGPDDPLLYVAELYGTIKVLTRDGDVGVYASDLLNFNPTGDFPGSGEQGLAGLVVDPASGDLFASLLYDAAPPSGPHYPKVVRFHSDDGGRTAAGTPSTVLDMVGETQGQSHQISNLSFGPDGKLYVHMGDGFVPSAAQNLESFRGKILRLNLNGTAPSDNPFHDGAPITARDYVFAYGFRNPFGGDWRAANGAHYEVENGPAHNDRLARVYAGTNYEWDGSGGSMTTGALFNWDPPHAPVNIAFVQPETFGGSGFPDSKMDHAFVTESGPTYASGPQVLGKRIVEFAPESGELGGHPHGLVEYTGKGYATAIGLAAGPDGLYFTDLYKDEGANDPTDSGAQLLRVRHGSAEPALPSSPPPSGGTQGASKSSKLKAAKRRCKRKFEGNARRACIRRAKQKARV